MIKNKISLLFILFLLFLQGCDKHPHITAQIIKEDLIGRNIDLQNSIQGWLFDQEEKKDTIITILESKYQDDQAKIIIEISTSAQASPFSRIRKVQANGRLKLHYEWTVDQWQLATIENISFKISN